MAGTVYLNGVLIPRERATVSVDDRGFVFGDGVYEVVRALDGRFFAAEPHLRRLVDGLRALEIEAGADAVPERLLEISLELLEANDLLEGHATVYMQVTRGAAPRTHYFPPAGTPPTVFLSAGRFAPADERIERGAEAITLPDIRWSRCDLKTVNLLPNVLGKQRAVAAGVLEAIFIRDGFVTEGSHTNVFGVIDGTLRTHPRTPYILPGVTRELLLEIAAEREIPVNLAPILAAELPQLEELFVCGTTMDVAPIVRLDGHAVGRGRPGSITRGLHDGLMERFASA